MIMIQNIDFTCIFLNGNIHTIVNYETKYMQNYESYVIEPNLDNKNIFGTLRFRERQTL